MSDPKKLSPMMQQYEQAKVACRDALLLFRMGDFYELFREDAKVAARALGLTLTSRDKNSSDPVPMAGFPHHQLDGYLAKLIKQGHRVAVCEQVEDPAKAKGLVRREVTRVVSPGTITDHELLDPRESNFLVSIVPKKATKSEPNLMGVAWVDISTGEFVACQIEPHQLLDFLARLCPSEILLPESAELEIPPFLSAREPVITRNADWVSAVKHSSDTLLRHFNVASLDGFGFSDEDQVALQAAGAILYYVSENQPTAVDYIDQIAPWSPGTSMEIDQATWRSLEITRTIRSGQRDGSLFDRIDRTVTSMGSRQLGAWLLRPMVCKEAIMSRQNAIEELVLNETRRRGLRSQLKGIYDIQRLLSRLTSGRATPRDLGSIRKTLANFPELKTRLANSQSRLLQKVEVDLDTCPKLFQQLEAGLEENCPLSAKEGGYIRQGFSAELDQYRELAAGGKQWIAEYQQRISEETAIPSIKVGFNKVFGYYLEVTHAHRDKLPESFIRKQTLKNAERFITPELKEYEDKVISADDRAKSLEYETFCELRNAVAEYLPRLKANAELIAHLDAIAALAELASTQNYVKPNITEDAVISITDGRHPVLDITEALGTFVPNSTALNEDQGLIHLITGPNMAGKSTYIRQTALIVLMAHVGSFVPATAATIGITDRLFARVGASDELSRGQSTFMVEMTETARILNTASPRSLVILDEIGRGTSTYDGVSLAWAIVEYLHESIGCRTMFATHYHELTQLEETLSSVANYNVAVKEWNDEIVFLHKIERGAADKSYGIHVAKLAGVPVWVNRRAGQILEQLENTQSEPVDMNRATSGASNGEIQLTLFNAPTHPLIDKIRRIDTNHVTPMGALEMLNQWREELVEENPESVSPLNRETKNRS